MNFIKNEDGCIRFTDTKGIDFKTWTLLLNRINWLGYAIPDEDSVKMYFDRGTFLNLDQSIEVLKVFGELHEPEIYSPAAIERDNQIAKEHFGLTGSFKLAGYLLIDGDLLKFSYDGYIRNIDHREIACPLHIDTDDDTSAGLIQFINYGNIRLLGRGFELCKPPTPAQRRRLASFIRNTADLYVDIANYMGTVVKSFYYPLASPSEVFCDIDNYFDSLKI